MNNKVKCLIIVGMCVSFLITLSFMNTAPVLAQHAVNKIEVVTAYDKAEVSAKVGDVIKITLNENTSTGYSWQIIDLPQQVELTEEQVIDDNPAGLVGAAHLKVFEFMIKESGALKIKLNYTRVWEKNTDNVENFELIVKSKK